jgi:ribosome biogenesis protein YTM1
MSTTQDTTESSKTVSVRFLTNEDEYRVTDKPFNVPVTLKRIGLSQVINHLLKTGLYTFIKLDNFTSKISFEVWKHSKNFRFSAEKPIPFDFLIDNEFLRTSLGEFLQQKGKSTVGYHTLHMDLNSFFCFYVYLFCVYNQCLIGVYTSGRSSDNLV